MVSLKSNQDLLFCVYGDKIVTQGVMNFYIYDGSLSYITTNKIVRKSYLKIYFTIVRL